MARKATRELAKQLLTAKQFAAWCRMSPKLSASELRAGKRPGGRKAKAAKRPGKRKASSASNADVFLARQWARHGGGLPADWEAGIRSNPKRRRKARKNPPSGFKMHAVDWIDGLLISGQMSEAEGKRVYAELKRRGLKHPTEDQFDRAVASVITKRNPGGRRKARKNPMPTGNVRRGSDGRFVSLGGKNKQVRKKAKFRKKLHAELREMRRLGKLPKRRRRRARR